MSTFLNPVGPKKKSVYIRRRLLVLIGLLVVVGAVVLVIVKPGSTGGAAEAPEVLLPDEVLAGEHQDNPSAIPNCGAGELRITPVTDENSYAAGEQPKLSMRIENIGDAQCQAQLGREIVDGKFSGKIVAPVTLTGYVPDLLQSMSRFSRDLELNGAGYCGKGWKEYVRVSLGGPYIKARGKLS